MVLDASTIRTTTLELVIDPDDTIEEIQENNNVLTTIVDVTAPGVKVTADIAERQVEYASQTTSTWNLTLENTALLETNASIDAIGIYLDSDGVEMPWYLGMTASNFTLQGKATADVSLTVVYPEAPEPGLYRIDLVGLDVDNAITYPLSVYCMFSIFPNSELNTTTPLFQFIQQIQPTSPFEFTTMEHRDWL